MSYQPNVRGQLVSVRLQNFMSYDEVELRPGSHLNLIIGPNGTGKSTFVCAIVLGFGGKLKVLGRADQINAYIKSGCKECRIDIELYEPDCNNIVLTRKIFSDKTYEFYINGSIAPASKVNDLRVKYNIQLDNLCTFLPQEKVHDFSKLNPQQLLDQTQNIVGSVELNSTFQELKKLQYTIYDKEKQNTALESHIQSEQQKNDRLKDKVKSFLERRTLCDKLTLIKQKKAWLCCQEEYLKLEKLIKNHELAREQFAEKRKTFRKVCEDLRCLEKQVETSEENYRKSKRIWEDEKSRLEEWQKKLKEYVGYFENFESNLEAKLNEEKNKEAEIQRYREILDKLKNDLLTFESTKGTDEQLKAKEADISKMLMKSYREESGLTEKKASFEDKLEQLTKEMKNISIECMLLEKRKNSRLEYLKRYEPDSYTSMEWLQKNRHHFVGQIFNPMLLEMDVTDVEAAKYVETRISYKDLISFICTNPDDLNLLIQKLRIEEKLQINAICSSDDNIDRYQPELELNQIRSFGFSWYMKDLITGPGHIISYLCKVYKIHTVPIGDETVKSKFDKVPICIPCFFSENHMFNVKVSSYSGEKSISIRHVDDPRLFNISMNNEKIKQLQEREKELKAAIEEKQRNMIFVTQELKSMAEKLESIKQEKRDLATLHEEKKQILLKLKRAQDNIISVEETLSDPSVILLEAEIERRNLQKEISEIFHKIMCATKKFQKHSRSKQKCEIASKIFRLKLNALQRKKTAYAETLSKFEEALSTAKTAEEEKQLHYAQLRAAATKLTDGLCPNDKGFSKFKESFKQLKDSLKELETEMQETQVMVDFLQGGNAQVLQEYERREEEIARLLAEQEQCKKSLEEVNSHVETLREAWLTPINRLISKINESFDTFFKTMGCAGEVCLVSGEKQNDFDQYGIVIRVKFRDEVPLQNLGRHFQSGGERAVATAVYLLSMQKLITVPFRFVDEINQGMDAENERRILNLMMDVTAEENTTQYFFITPKLLPKIKCSETMVVHCIYSGRRAIRSKDWNLQNIIAASEKG